MRNKFLQGKVKLEEYFQIGQKIYNHIALKKKQNDDNLVDYFNVYGEELDENENLPNKNDLNDEIGRLMENYK